MENTTEELMANIGKTNYGLLSRDTISKFIVETTKLKNKIVKYGEAGLLRDAVVEQYTILLCDSRNRIMKKIGSTDYLLLERRMLQMLNALNALFLSLLLQQQNSIDSNYVFGIDAILLDAHKQGAL